MNKKFTSIFASIISSICLFCACGAPSADSSSVGGQQPTGLRFVGDLQALYGGEKGYPQAVLVAKTEFLESYEGWTEHFLSEISATSEWLKTAEVQTIVSAVSAHLTEGMKPSLNAKNLNSEVISRCGIRFEAAADCKEEVDAFLGKLIAVNENTAKTVSESFYYVSSPTVSSESPLTAEIYMPDGATALAMAKLMHEDSSDDGVDYHVVEATTIQTYVTGGNPKADLCILPLNLASKLLGEGKTYKMLGTVTHGNLYMLSTDGEIEYTAENLSSLAGKTVGVIQLPNVPGLTFKIILNQNGIPWQELTNDMSPAADKVNLKAMDAASVNPAAGLDAYVVPEPAASAKVKAK